MEWTRDKTLALINEYRKRRGLWDMTHDDYRKKEMKQKLLVEVAASLGDSIPVVEIEKKFHTLRTQYHREINRMKRKEPYNSKWFGFKNLQFLSSPKACRMGKGRMKSEITEDGTVTTYIIRESSSLQAQSRDNSGGSNSNLNEEFVALDSKPTTTITYESTSSSAVAVASASRSRELEKLIEETTKDVDEIEENKPKMQRVPKEIHTLPLEHHSYSATVSSNGEMSVNEHHHPMHQQQQQQHQHHHEPHHMEEKQHVETIDIQTAGEEITYQPTSSPGSGGDHHQPIHHQAIPARIIKIQRRDTCTEEEFYDEDEQQHQHHQHQHQHQGHVNSSAKHRIYYEPNGPQHTTTILATPTCTTIPNANSTLLGHTTLKLQRNSSNGSQQMQQQHQQQQQCRDEFSTYGEYVANEMRGISSREILVALKHKINTALFEASMAELQK